MTYRICLHLDENVDPDVARALRRHGIDVTTTQETGLCTQSDIAQFAFSGVDYFCTCDDRLLKKAKAQADLKVIVRSPLELAQEITA